MAKKSIHNKKALGILRVSSSGQKEGVSHETQDKFIRQYCRDQGFDVVDVVPIIESGKDSENRKKYNALIKRALVEEIHNVIFYTFDRETRNLTDVETNEKYIRVGLLSLHYALDRKVMDQNSPDSDFFMRDVQAVTSKHYSRVLSTKVTDAMQMKAEMGWYPSNSPPLGYSTWREKDAYGRERKIMAIVVPDPDVRNIKVVQREFELRAQGFTGAYIHAKVIEEGLVAHLKKNQYHFASVHERLTNPFYWGRFRWQDKEYEGKHELIIPPEHLKKVADSFGRKHYLRKPKGIFAGGWLRCATPECDCSVIYDPKQKYKSEELHKYYHCSNGRKVHRSMKGMNVREEDLWNQFGEMVGGITITKELAAEIAAALNESKEKAREATKREIASYKTAIADLESRRRLAFDLFVKDKVSEGDYRLQADHLESQQKEYTELLEGAQLRLTDVVCETAKSILELSTNAKSLWLSKTPEEQRADLDKILSNYSLDGVTVRYQYKPPFQWLAQIKTNEGKEEWCAFVPAYRTWFAQNRHFNTSAIKELQVA